jgi:prolyl-tRNA editing enzyme YbaK/EbsC (Cys-tRNA(Pro) deacylase)
VTTLKNSAQRVQEILKSYGLQTEVVEFADTTRTAQEAANAIGCDVAQIAKSLIFRGKQSEKPVLVIASGKNKVDENKIQLLIGEGIERPDADYVLEKTGFAIGGIPPVGYLCDTVLFDEDLLKFDLVWAAAGTPFAVFSIVSQDLVKITKARVISVKKN